MSTAAQSHSTTLENTIAFLLASGKGILAADESFPTIEKRFKTIDLESTEAARRDYRDLLFSTKGLSEFVSGVILFDETLHQRASNGRPFPQFLAEAGMVPGIKVDAGTEPLAGFDGEKITQGLDGLRERLATYYDAGARFTKWRATISIGEHLPTRGAIDANAHTLARFAALSLEAGLVPIIEPEVLMDGDHSIERCEAVTTLTLERVFSALVEQRVTLERVLLKTGMVLAGKEAPQPADVDTIAKATVRCLRRAVPAAVPGIVFLSGGQSETDATVRLNAISQRNSGPWALTFSYGRALQDSALKTWAGAPAKVVSAQAALLHRAKCNSLAVEGKYTAQADSI